MNQILIERAFENRYPKLFIQDEGEKLSLATSVRMKDDDGVWWLNPIVHFVENLPIDSWEQTKFQLFRKVIRDAYLSERYGNIENLKEMRNLRGEMIVRMDSDQNNNSDNLDNY